MRLLYFSMSKTEMNTHPEQQKGGDELMTSSQILCTDEGAEQKKQGEAELKNTK